MRELFLITILVASFTSFGQVTELPFTLHNGRGPMKYQSFGGISFSKHNPESSWGKMAIEMANVPDGFHVDIQHTDIFQFVWQNYTNGILPKESLLFFVKSWKMDTTSEYLTRSFVKCYVNVAIKRENDSTYLYIVDRNNNHDFSDDTVRVAALNDYENLDELFEKHAITFDFEYYLNHEVHKETREIVILENPDKSQMTYVVTFPHHGKAFLEHNGQQVPLYFKYSSPFRHSDSSSVVIQHPIDSVGIRTKQFLILDATAYRVIGANRKKQVLLLEKKQLVKDSYFPQIGFLAPEIVGLEFSSGDTLSLSEYNKKYVFLYIWATWCAPCYTTLPKLAVLNDSISADELQIFSVHKRSNPKSLPKVLEEFGIQWPQILHSDCSTDVESDYGLTNSGVPLSMLISPEGRILAMNFHWADNLAQIVREKINADQTSRFKK